MGYQTMMHMDFTLTKAIYKEQVMMNGSAEEFLYSDIKSRLRL
jgi:hypothetical protein